LTQSTPDCTLDEMHRLAWLAGALLAGCGASPLEPRDPDPGAFHFTVETYNLNNDDGADLATVETIGNARSDIVCVQEITDVSRAAIEARYAAIYPYRLFKVDPTGGAAGLGIMSRFPVIDGGWREGKWHPAWYYFIETPKGRFGILNAHLRNATGQHGNTVQSYLRTDEDHLEEIKYFTAQCTKVMPTLVLGDFNEGPSGAAVQYLETDGFQNVLPLFHPGQPTWRYKATVGGQFTQTLDHILFDSSFVPLNAWVVNAGGSDHLPVVAHFQAAGW